MSKILQGQKAIVTGANRSIGRAVAEALAKEGTDVAISYRSDRKGALETVRRIEEHGQKGYAFYADFLEPKGVERFFQEAVDALGHVDILVNNAGGYDTRPFLDLDVKTFENVFRIGVTTAMQLTQLVAKQMIEKAIAGRVVNISSISGVCPHPNRVAHGAAKAALNMLTKNCALELGPHQIRVNGLAPGGVPYEGEEWSADGVPLGRTGKPLDQAEAVLYLVSEASSWMTGHLMTVDGGQSL